MNRPGSQKGWKTSSEGDFWGEITPSDHILQLYSDQDENLDLLQGFVSHGLDAGDSVIIIATTDHLRSLSKRLRVRGYDLFSLMLQDQYIPLSASETLSSFVINGWPDENLFYHFLANLLLRARKRERRVRVYGEMVSLLWQEGSEGATLHLEHLWTRFCESEKFTLLCAYPEQVFDDNSHDALMTICGCHSQMVTTAKSENVGELLVSPRSN